MKKKQEIKNFILVQIMDGDRTLTTFNGEPHHVKLLKDYIVNVFINQTGGQTIWIELPVTESNPIIL